MNWNRDKRNVFNYFRMRTRWIRASPSRRISGCTANMIRNQPKMENRDINWRLYSKFLLSLHLLPCTNIFFINIFIYNMFHKCWLLSIIVTNILFRFFLFLFFLFSLGYVGWEVRSDSSKFRGPWWMIFVFNLFFYLSELLMYFPLLKIL